MGLKISAIATVPFSNRSTFLTAPSSKYSKNLEYDILLEVDAFGLSGSGSALAELDMRVPGTITPREAEFNSDLLEDFKFG